MNAHTLPETLTLLGLAGADAGRSVAEIAKPLGNDLKPLLASLKSALAETPRRLVELGLVEALPLPPRSRTPRWRLLPAGSEALVRQIGGASLQGKGAIARVARQLIVAHTLHVSPPAAGVVMRKRNALLACLLARQLGEPFHETTTLETLAATVAARALGASNTQPATLRHAVLRHALDQGAAGLPSATGVAPSRPEPPREMPPADRAGITPRDFPATVLNAARTLPTAAWFDERKLFIHRAWEAWRAQGGDTDLPTFKTRLLAALRAGELGLTRADFTVTLDSADLAAAELRDGSETFHFLTVERDPQL